MDNKTIAKWLRELLAFRDRELSSLMEFNNFSSEDDIQYAQVNQQIEDTILKLDSESCDIKELTLDEAIQHAKEVGGNGETSCKKQHLQLAQWLSELKDLKNCHLLLAADFDNFKKRVAREKDIVNFESKKKFALGILRVFDDMERLMLSVQKREENGISTNEDAGFKLIYNNLMQSLQSQGCKKIECDVGQTFDVNFHEAIATKQIDNSTSLAYAGTIADVVQSGWLLDNQLLRPTKVVVYQ